MMNRGIEKNLITNMLSVVVTMLANFIVTPIITEKLGLAAYSYVGIINNIISFFTVFSYTLNSMVGRFYTISYNKNETEESNKYISTALYSCLIVGGTLIAVMSIVDIFLEKLIIIESDYVTDVKIAFFIASISFVLSMINSVFSTGAYAKNALYITNTYSIVVGIFKSVLVYILFLVAPAKIWFVSGTSALQTAIIIILAYYSFKKLIPTVRFSRKLFSVNKAKELVSSGAFNGVIMMGNTLMTQIDLLVGNRFLNAELVGAYSVVLLFSTMMRSIGSAVSNSFSPTTLKVFTDQGEEGVKTFSNQIVRLVGIILGWPSVGIACLGCAFVQIWMGRDLSAFEYVFVILMLPMGSNLACTQLYVVQQALNKLKVPAVASIVAGVFNVILAVVMVSVFKMGVIGLAVASTISFSLRNIIFQPIYTSIITHQHFTAYFIGLIKPILINLLVYGIWFVFKNRIMIDNILELIVAGIILSLVYFGVTFILLNKEDKKLIGQYISTLLRRRDK